MTARVRPAYNTDASVYARLFPELATGDPPPTPERIAPLVPRMRIAEVDGVPRAFAVAGIEGEVGFVRQIVVDPAARRRGVGRTLFRAVADELRAQGARRMRLNVKEDNAAAIALYRQMGLRVDFRSAALWMTHAARRRLEGSREPLALFRPGPGDDAALGARFGMPADQLAFLRASKEAPCAVRPAGGGAPLGFMRFSPEYPGAYPFCASGAAPARALLGEVERLVPAAPRYGLVVERDEALVRVLGAAGATLRFWMLQMEGPLATGPSSEGSRTPRSRS